MPWLTIVHMVIGQLVGVSSLSNMWVLKTGLWSSDLAARAVEPSC